MIWKFWQSAQSGHGKTGTLPRLFVQNGQEAKKLPATVVIFDRNGYNNHKIAGKRTVPEPP